jgi:hypothetical protein
MWTRNPLLETWLDFARISFTFAARDTNLDPRGRHLRVFLFPHTVDLGRPYIRVSGKFPVLVHGGPVANGGISGQPLSPRLQSSPSASGSAQQFPKRGNRGATQRFDGDIVDS